MRRGEGDLLVNKKDEIPFGRDVLRAIDDVEFIGCVFVGKSQNFESDIILRGI